jgi:UDP-galactose transporter B1
MLLTINKWSSIWALCHLILKNELKEMFFYSIYHPGFMRDLLILTAGAFVGQMFIYRMIKQFKQHVVPFVVTTRKIFTVGLSIVYFHHETSAGQIAAIILVLSVTVYEFMDNIRKGEKGPIQ